MLRRKLILTFGSLIALLAVMSIAAILLLQGLLRELDHVNGHGMAAAEHASSMSATMTGIQMELYSLQLDRTRHLDGLIAGVTRLRQLAETMSATFASQETYARPDCQAILDRLPAFEQHVSSLATAQDAELTRQYNVTALGDAVGLLTHIRRLEAQVHGHLQEEQQAVAARFRWLVLGMAAGFLLMINVTVVVLLRAAGLVLKPVDKLVEASRQLAQERFDYRAELNQRDEFGELASSYNALAERLQGNERRQLETLSQVALALNHELNNALAIIELQLQVLGKRSDGNPAFGDCLGQIHEGLRRMAAAVEALKNIRQIVLTDYVAGVKMLDLQRSAEPPPAPAPVLPVDEDP